MDNKTLRDLLDKYQHELVNTDFLHSVRMLMPELTLQEIPQEEQWKYQGRVCRIGSLGEPQLLLSMTDDIALLLGKDRSTTYITELDKVFVDNVAPQYSFHDIALWTEAPDPSPAPRKRARYSDDSGDYFLDRGITTDGFTDEYGIEMLDGSPF